MSRFCLMYVRKSKLLRGVRKTTQKIRFSSSLFFVREYAQVNPTLTVKACLGTSSLKVWFLSRRWSISTRLNVLGSESTGGMIPPSASSSTRRLSIMQMMRFPLRSNWGVRMSVGTTYPCNPVLSMFCLSRWAKYITRMEGLGISGPVHSDTKVSGVPSVGCVSREGSSSGSILKAFETAAIVEKWALAGVRRSFASLYTSMGNWKCFTPSLRRADEMVWKLLLCSREHPARGMNSPCSDSRGSCMPRISGCELLGESSSSCSKMSSMCSPSFAPWSDPCRRGDGTVATRVFGKSLRFAPWLQGFAPSSSESELSASDWEHLPRFFPITEDIVPGETELGREGKGGRRGGLYRQSQGARGRDSKFPRKLSGYGCAGNSKLGRGRGAINQNGLSKCSRGRDLVP